MMKSNRYGWTLAALLVLSACGDRDEVWEADVDGAEALAMAGTVAIVDPEADRALLLETDAELGLDMQNIPIGTGFARAAVTPDGDRMLVLSRGVIPRRSAEDEPPSLSLIASAEEVTRFELADPLSGLAVDPEGRFAVVFASARP